MAEMKKSYPKVRFKSANVAPGTNMMGVRAMYDAGGHGRRADGFSQANGWSMEYLLGKTWIRFRGAFYTRCAITRSPVASSM